MVSRFITRGEVMHEGLRLLPRKYGVAEDMGGARRGDICIRQGNDVYGMRKHELGNRHMLAVDRRKD